MSGIGPLPFVVADSEELARYLFSDRNVRADQSVKPDEFVPYSHVELSVTRHLGLTENDIWRLGLQVGSERQRPLHGRADLLASDYRAGRLEVVPDPVANNPNHANVTGWPKDKAAQKMVATEFAARARFVRFAAQG